MAVHEGLTALVWTVLCTVLAPLLLGAGLVRGLGLAPQSGRRVFFAYAFLVGQFAQAWLTAAWLAAGRPTAGALLPLAAALLGYALWWWAARRAQPVPRTRRCDPVVLGCLFVVGVLAWDRMTSESLQPLLAGDDADIWTAKAKVLFTAPPTGLDFGSQYARHPAYPCFNPLVQVLAFAGHDRVLLWENRIPIQVFGLALLSLLAAIVESLLPRWLAVIALLAFGTSSFLTWTATAYSDALVAFALLAAVDAYRRHAAGEGAVWGRLGGIALAALLASKNEGAMLGAALGLACAAVHVVGRRPWARPSAALLWLLVPAATWAAGAWFNHRWDLHNDLTDPVLTEGRGLLGQMVHFFPARIGPVLAHYGGLLLDGDGTRLLLPVALLAPFVAGGNARQADRWLPWLVVAAALCGYVLVFVGTNANTGGPDGPMLGLLWHLRTAADRTLLHLLPTAVLALALLWARADGSPRSAQLA